MSGYFFPHWELDGLVTYEIHPAVPLVTTAARAVMMGTSIGKEPWIYASSEPVRRALQVALRKVRRLPYPHLYELSKGVK